MSRDVRATAIIVPPQPSEPDVVLTLSPDVARTLRELARVVGGSATNSYRGDIDAIAEALDRAGVRRGGLRFRDSTQALDVWRS